MSPLIDIPDTYLHWCSNVQVICLAPLCIRTSSKPLSNAFLRVQIGKPAILQSLSDTVRYTIHRACMWFNSSKQHNNALKVHKVTKIRAKSRNMGVARTIFLKCTYTRACPYGVQGWIYVQKNLKLSTLEFGVFRNCLSWSTKKSSKLSIET